MLPNALRFDGGHGQIVETTSVAAAPALKPIAMTLRESIHDSIDLGMERNECLEH